MMRPAVRHGIPGRGCSMPRPMDTLTAIRTRRTVKRFTGAPLDRAQVEALVEAACWAPTHRLTQPWRFALLDQPAIARLGAWLDGREAVIAQPDPAKGAAKWAKLKAALPTLGALVMAGWKRAADPDEDREDHAAACAAVQNLLLAATAMGIGSFWSTNPMLSHAQTRGWAGLDPQCIGWIGALWLGRVDGPLPPPPPRRSVGDAARWC